MLGDRSLYYIVKSPGTPSGTALSGKPVRMQNIPGFELPGPGQFQLYPPGKTGEERGARAERDGIHHDPELVHESGLHK
jgi:hypothetical protein